MAALNPTKEQMERLKLVFSEAKAENDLILKSAKNDIFVHTKVFKEIQDSKKCLVVGRKGSGKTALIWGYKNENKDSILVESTIDIQADDFPIDGLYSFFHEDFRKNNEKFKEKYPISDLPDFTDPIKVSTFAWKQSLIYTAIYASANEILIQDYTLTEDEIKILKKAKQSIGKLIGVRVNNIAKATKFNGGETVFALLVYFFQSLQGTIDNVLGVHTHEIAVTFAAITLALSKKMSRHTANSLEPAVKIIAAHFAKHEKKTLLTLDKFDDFYDDFYARTLNEEHSLERKRFLSNLLYGLIIAAREINRDEKFKWIDSVFAVPMDKFLQLHIRERADLETSNVQRLEWTPKELLEFVNRRIAYALDLLDEQKDSAWEILFPFSVRNGKLREVKEHSFLYIVRHSLWKPREIQMYLRAIFKEMDELRKPADEEMFRRVVSVESEKIIRREFIEEFSSEYPGIRNILKKLKNMYLQSVIKYEDLCDSIWRENVHEGSENAMETVKFLFKAGVIGVREVYANPRRQLLNPTVRQQREEVAYQFCYNCTDNDPFTQGISIVFHPMFFEYLNIKHIEQFVINQLIWDMFQLQEPTRV